MIMQLKPSERSYETFVLSDVKSFKVFILCEGRTESEVLKILYKRLGFSIDKPIAISDCGGINKVYGIAQSIALIANLSRKLSVLAVVVDADELEFNGRFNSLVNSLRSQGIEVNTQCQVLDKQIFKTRIKGLKRDFDFYVVVNGVTDYEFPKHVLEDHVIKLLELQGKLRDIAKESITSKVGSSKELIRSHGIDVIKEISNAEVGVLRESFSHLVRFLELIRKDP